MKSIIKITQSILINLGLYFAMIGQVYAQSAPTEKPTSIVPEPWQETVVSVYDLGETARFFTEIAGYGIIWRGAETSATLSHLGLGEKALGIQVVILVLC